MTTTSSDVPTVLEPDWDGPVLGFRISVATTDDLGFPMTRRSADLKVPREFADQAEFARRVGSMVEETVRISLGFIPKEKEEANQ